MIACIAKFAKVLEIGSLAAAIDCRGPPTLDDMLDRRIRGIALAWTPMKTAMNNRGSATTPWNHGVVEPVCSEIPETSLEDFKEVLDFVRSLLVHC